MNEKPILFKGEMVRAVLAGTKTKTRRVVKPRGSMDWERMINRVTMPEVIESACKCPYGVPGDELWVRETFWAWGHWEKRGKTKMGKPRWRFVDQTDDAHPVLFDTDGKPTGWAIDRAHLGYHKRPSIFMPRWASRIQLVVKSVRVERVQEIDEADAKAEGTALEPGWSEGQKVHGWGAYSFAFCHLWDSINGKPRKDGTDISWGADPYVWVVEFEMIKG